MKPRVSGNEVFVLVTPQTNMKMNHTSEESNRHPKKASMAWKMWVLNISNSVRWNQIRKEDAEEITSGITERYGNQPPGQLFSLNKDKAESGDYSCRNQSLV